MSSIADTDHDFQPDEPLDRDGEPEWGVELEDAAEDLSPEQADEATAAPVDPATGQPDLVDAMKPVQDFFAARSDVAPYNQVISYVTETYLKALDPENPPAPPLVEKRLMGLVNAIVRSENAKTKEAGEKLPRLKELTHWQIAQVLLRLHHVVRIKPGKDEVDKTRDVLAMYQVDPQDPNLGTYSTSEDDLLSVAEDYDIALTNRGFEEVMTKLRKGAPRVTECSHRDLIAVNNGVFNYSREPVEFTELGKTFTFEPKALLPFDPALVFTAKSHVNYRENPDSPVIVHPLDGSEWEFHTWLEDLFDQEGQEGLATLVWEILGAIIRPRVSWGKTAWFYSEKGNNGKGTLCSLMRNLVGDGAHTSIPLSDFGKEFALEPLMRCNAIITDENDVGTFIDKAANLKAIATNDVIQINRKFLKPVAFQFWGLNVQCLNELPRMKDKSASNDRRHLFVPFEKSFTGRERKYIKDDYLKRPEVLEYVLWYALNRAGAANAGKYYEFSEPPATKAVLAEYKEYNDPVRAFWNEFRIKFNWDLLPFPFLYDLFKSWFAEQNPTGSVLSSQKFSADLLAVLESDETWHCKDKRLKIRPGSMMDAVEPLIAEYDLKKWMHPYYDGKDVNKRCRPELSASYRGVQRYTVGPTPGETTEEAIARLEAQNAALKAGSRTDDEKKN